MAKSKEVYDDHNAPIHELATNHYFPESKITQVVKQSR